MCTDFCFLKVAFNNTFQVLFGRKNALVFPLKEQCLNKGYDAYFPLDRLSWLWLKKFSKWGLYEDIDMIGKKFWNSCGGIIKNF